MELGAKDQGISENVKPCVCVYMHITHTHICIHSIIEADIILQIWLQKLSPHPTCSSYNVPLTLVPLNIGIYTSGWKFVIGLTRKVQWQ